MPGWPGAKLRSWRSRGGTADRPGRASRATLPAPGRASPPRAGGWAQSWHTPFPLPDSGRLVRPQSFAQPRAGPVEQHAHVIDGDAELLGDLDIAEAFETGQAKDLRLARVELGEGFAQPLAQLAGHGGLFGLGRIRRHR